MKDLAVRQLAELASIGASVAAGRIYHVAGVPYFDTGAAIVPLSAADYRVIDIKRATRTAGDVSLTSISVVAVDSGLDLTLVGVQAGDIVEVGINGLLGSQQQSVGFDVYTMVGGSPVNPFGAGLNASLSGANGITGWLATANAVDARSIGHPAFKTLVSGDISAGSCTLQLRYVKSNTTARNLSATTASPFVFWAKAYRAGSAAASVQKPFLDYKTATRTSGSISLTATAITNVDTGLDLTLANVQAGDVVEYGWNALFEDNTQAVGFDVYTVVGGSPVNPFGAGLSASLASTVGVPAWFVGGQAINKTNGIPQQRTLVSGDISAGSVTLRLRYAKSSATARSLNATANIPLSVWARAFRP